MRYGPWARALDKFVIAEDLEGETICIDCCQDIIHCECNLNAAS